MMRDSPVSDRLIALLSDQLDRATATSLVGRLAQSGCPLNAVLALLNELRDVSAKAAALAIEAFPALDRRGGLSQVVSWLDLGVALAQSSGATALKYFKDSPLILGVIKRCDSQAAVLTIGLEMAEHDANVAWEYLKAAPGILTVVPFEQLQPWLEIGAEVAAVDPVVGIEYIRQISAVAPVLPLGEVRGWLSFGMKLIAPNTLGKPDYLATLEFLRTSPTILAGIEQQAIRSKVVSIGSALAMHAPETAIAWLAESPTLLRKLPSEEWRIKVLQYGVLLAEKDADTALAYLRRGSEMAAMLGDGVLALSRFEDWFKAGMDVLTYSPEAARAYFRPWPEVNTRRLATSPCPSGLFTFTVAPMRYAPV